MVTVINVTGMSCQHCVATVEKAAKSVHGVTGASANLEAGNVTVEGDFDRADAVKAIKAAGYDAF